MQYRLCDVITWVFCQDLGGVVPRHGKRSIMVAESTVRFLFPMAIYPDFPKSFASMSSITKVITDAAALLTKVKGNTVEKVDNQADGTLSEGLNKLWRRFGIFSDRASVASICQNLVLVAYHVCCLVEVRLFGSMIYLSNNGGAGLWGHPNPCRNSEEGPFQNACPTLSISFCISPHHSLWDCMAYKRFQ